MYGISLFTGYAGIDIALSEYVRPIIYCDIEQYAQGIILSRMDDGTLPFAPIWNDITTLDGTKFRGLADIIYGGFPCQDLSVAGKGAGLAGKRSGLFFEIIRLCEEASPTFIFLENVPAIRTRGSIQVQEALASIGYDTRWLTLSASEVGANHRRERWFCLAYSKGCYDRFSDSRESNGQVQQSGECSGKEYVSDTDSTIIRKQSNRLYKRQDQTITRDNGKKESMANTSSEDLPRSDLQRQRRETTSTTQEDHEGIREDYWWAVPSAINSDWWSIEPRVDRGASDGVNKELDLREGQILHASKKEKRINEIVRLVWGDTAEEEILRQIRGYERLQKTQVLQQIMYGEVNGEDKPYEVCYSVEGTKIQEEIMRIMSINRDAGNPSYRWGLEQQSFEQFEDAVLFLSHIFASISGRLGREEIKTTLLHLWKGIVSQGFLPHSPLSIQEIWGSIDGQWKKSLIMTEWIIEPPVPRVVNSCANRADRVKALGNGVVPLQVKTAFEILMGIK
jgi:DNA (cytosine-5)-methyltransferase 1